MYIYGKRRGRMQASVNERELVLDMLLQITRDGEYSHIVIKNVLDKYQYLDKRERAFITRVVNGTLERMIEIDYIINLFTKVRNIRDNWTYITNIFGGEWMGCERLCNSPVARSVLIGGEGCPHRCRTISSSVAKVQVKVTCQEKRMEEQSETPV